jgi:hypothetical protein
MSPEEIVRAAFQHRRQRKQRAVHEEMVAQHHQWKEQAPLLTQALRALTAEQGQRIAEDIWRDFDPREDDYLRAQLGASVPGALATTQDDMVQRRVFYPPHLYLDANDEIANKLIELISAPVVEESYNCLLLCLAWVGNERVIRQFQAWREDPPAWRSELYVPPWEYSLEAGWELTDAGTRLDLYLPTAYEVIALGESEHEHGNYSAFTILAPHEEQCGWCGRQLLTVLQLDLRVPGSRSSRQEALVCVSPSARPAPTTLLS